MSRAPVLLLPLLLLSHCAPPPPTAETRANAATMAACREHADEAYNRTHRDSIYTISNRDTPFSGNYTPSVVDRGLSQRFGRETMVRECVRNAGADTSGPPTAAPGPTPKPTP